MPVQFHSASGQYKTYLKGHIPVQFHSVSGQYQTYLKRVYTCPVGRPIFWSFSQKIKQLRGRSVGCVN